MTCYIPALRAAAACALALAATLTMTGEARPQALARCGDAAAIADHLVTRYHEAPLFEGLDGGGNTVTLLFANPATGTWTLLRVHPDGTACMIAAGEAAALIGGLFYGDPA